MKQLKQQKPSPLLSFKEMESVLEEGIYQNDNNFKTLSTKP